MNNPAFADVMDAALDKWVGREGRARLEAVVPGAAREELTARLRTEQPAHWPRACAEHVKLRAEELCAYLKDGDLWHCGGAYWWVYYDIEVVDAVRAVGGGRKRLSRCYDEAKIAFVTVVDAIRDRRLGPPERRAAMTDDEIAALDATETLAEAMERLEGSEAAR